MRQQFQQTKVRDLISSGALFVTDGYRMRNVELASSGIPFVRGGDIGDGSINTMTDDHIAPQFAERIVNKLSRPGDVVFITKGTVGRVGFLRPHQPQVVFAPQVCCWRVVNLEALEPRFIFYLLKSAEFQANLDAVKTHGSMVADYVSLRDQMNFSLTVPPINEQRSIASVLGSLDDKIELSRRMNETLEALAQSLFKSWFVDAIQSTLPKGWREVPFTEIVEIIGGGTPKTSVAEYWGGDIPWFSVVDSPQGSDLFVIDTEKKITKAGIENSSTQVLPVGTTIITARGTVGKIALVGVPMAMNQSCYGLRGKAGKKGFHTYFVTRALVSQLQQHAHGSVFDTITRDTLAGVQVALPPAAVVEQFEERVSPLMERIRNNLHESRTLATLRDALLPKLLSGELRVPAAEKLMEAHA